MSKHHHRRKFAATSGKRLTNLNTATLDQQLDETLRRVRAEFESTGKICSRFECVTDGESFHVAANWPDRNARVRYARCCGIAFVAAGSVRVERTKPGARARVLGWLPFLSEELLGHSRRGLARYGKAPRQGTAPGNASIQESRFER